MILFKLTHNGFSHPSARVHKNNKGEMFFNLFHGSKGSHFWEWRCGIDKNVKQPNRINDTLVLDNDNYILNTLKSNNKPVTDDRGNTMYNISIDDMETHQKDAIVLWEIPNKNYVNIRYLITSDVRVLGEGKAGKERDDIIFLSDCPVLEIMGDAKLEWSGNDDMGNKVYQTIHYDYENSKFDIGEIKKVKI